jgi:hypothetical protein
MSKFKYNRSVWSDLFLVRKIIKLLMENKNEGMPSRRKELNLDYKYILKSTILYDRPQAKNKISFSYSHKIQIEYKIFN